MEVVVGIITIGRAPTPILIHRLVDSYGESIIGPAMC